MNNKEIKFNTDAKKSLLHGMEILASAVGSTLGPKGQCVVLDEYSDGKPLVTKDGVTVARNIQLKDKFSNLGVQLLKEASITSVDNVGDGTTSTVVLAYDLCKSVQTLIDKGVNPIVIRDNINEVCKKLINGIKHQAIPIKDGDIQKIATISANNDPEIGSLIAEAFNKIGKDGVITVEESASFKTTIDVIMGMQFDRGYESPFFATDQIKGICNFENPYIFLTDRKIQLTKEIIPILEIAAKKNKPILIIAQDYDDEVIQNLKINNMRGILKVCAVKTPSYGEYRKAILEDLGILTGAKVITYESGIELHKVTEDALGKSEKVTVTRDNTIIANGAGNIDAINARINQIKQLANNLPDSYDQEFLKTFYAERIAKLSGGICVIHVGGTTDLEMKERKDRVEDAVCATKAAIEEGIVPGGGVSFIKSALFAAGESNIFSDTFTESEQIMLLSMWSVLNQICINCGLNTAPELDFKNNIGFDANKMESVNMLEAGIINPAKVDRTALENAFSVLNLYLSANCLVVNEQIEF